jgi:hypothetical protein
VEVEVSNSGYLSTSITDRGLVGEELEEGGLRRQVVRPPWARIEGEGVEVLGGVPRQTLGHLAGTNPILRGVTERSRNVVWTVRIEGGSGALRIVAGADKAGIVRTPWMEVR